MTRKERNKLAMRVGLAAIEEIEESVLPDAEEPIIIPRKNGDLRISMTWEDEFDQILKWKRFKEFLVDSDPDLLEALIPKFQELVNEMKTNLAQYQ